MVILVGGNTKQMYYALNIRKILLNCRAYYDEFITDKYGIENLPYIKHLEIFDIVTSVYIHPDLYSKSFITGYDLNRVMADMFQKWIDPPWFTSHMV